jgi:DNA-binding NarL/FixJ family response regulator
METVGSISQVRIVGKSNTSIEQLPQQQTKAGELRPITPSYGLTPREMSVLGLIAEGLADKEIAVQLRISTYTVNKEVRSILSKMNVASRTAAAVRAVKTGLLKE